MVFCTTNMIRINSFIFWKKMQAIKKIKFLFWALILTGCQQLLPIHSDNISVRSGFEQSSDMSYSEFASIKTFSTAMLLPLSGKAATYGQGLKNAAMMALEDMNNTHLVINFYDTKSTPAGAASAAKEAANDGNKLIIGPLMSEEVAAAGKAVHYDNIPLISFSTSPAVLQKGIYTLGLLNNEQVERIISYAAKKGRQKIAVLVPDTTSGLSTAKAAVFAAAANGAEVVKIAFYPPETLDFAETVKAITDYETSSAEINKQKEMLQKQATAGDTQAVHELAMLKTVYSSGEVDFDAILIAENGNRLKSAAAMFGYYDISYPNVLFMGTSMWENTSLSKETTLYHSVYPVLSRVHNDYFNKKYENLFEQHPNQLFSFAYDSVALASALSKKNPNTLTENITDPDGYIGINGIFRIYENGTNKHSLDIVENTSGGAKIIDFAPKKIKDETSLQDNLINPYLLSHPQIYGKDATLVYTHIFGKQ